MYEEEKATVKKRFSDHYLKNWSKILMPLLRYKRPNVTNADFISSKTLSDEPESPVYFHVDWVKPGKSTYVVQ
jgi:hypothetical protein